MKRPYEQQQQLRGTATLSVPLSALHYEELYSRISTAIGTELISATTTKRLLDTAVSDYLARLLFKEIVPLSAAASSIRVPGDLSSAILVDRSTYITVTHTNIVMSIVMEGAEEEGGEREKEAFIEWAIARLRDEGDLQRGSARSFVNYVIDQEYIRAIVVAEGAAAFVSDGSVLIDGVIADNAPTVVPFLSPPEHRKELLLPCSVQRVCGMWCPKGVTVVCGGGYHGKSTFLQAMARGVHSRVVACSRNDHQQYVVTDRSALHIRAEDGRQVHSVDCSAFFHSLPQSCSIDVRDISSGCASGSLSMAAAVVEAVHAGCRLLLVDEDSSAANFLTNDSRMRAMLKRDSITPFISYCSSLAAQGVSSIVVVGGCGEWFDVHTTCLLMDEYQLEDVTRRAHSISKSYCTGRVQFGGRGLVHRYDYEVGIGAGRRMLRTAVLRQALCGGDVRAGERSLYLHRRRPLREEKREEEEEKGGGEELCDLSRVEQLPRCRSYISGLLACIRRLSEHYCVQEVPVDTLVADLSAGLLGQGQGASEAYTASPSRAIDVICALNRLRVAGLFVLR